MKFADIPKFTRDSIYHININLNYLQTWISEQQDDLKFQLNPDFQRGHVWIREQQIAYVEYILQGGKSGLELYFNIPGANQDWRGDFVCVDGLQRITACLEFVNDNIPAFGYYISEYEDALRMADVNLSININNLKTRREVLTWYLEMNTGGTIHTDTELKRVQKLLEDEK